MSGKAADTELPIPADCIMERTRVLLHGDDMLRFHQIRSYCELMEQSLEFQS